MDPAFWMELYGYLGSVLIVVSMLMTSVTKLRIFNLIGSLFSLVYGLICHAMPVFVLNLCLAVINGIQIYRLYHPKKEE